MKLLMTLIRVLCLLPILTAEFLFGQTTRGNVQLQLTPDYSLAIGSSGGGSAYSFALGGQTLAQGQLSQLGLFHYDNSLASASRITPVQSVGTSFVPGKWGSALAIAPGGKLSYPVAGNLNFQTGTIEMWISPRFDGTNAIYGQYNHSLVLYSLPNGDQFIVAENSNRNFYAGTVINRQFVGAGGGDISSWKAGDWHHIAFTYSAAEGRQRLYLDGVLITEHRGAMPAPGAGGSSFTVDSDLFGNSSAFLLDELRISNDEKSPAIIQYSAKRSSPFANNEVYLSMNGVSPGQLTYSVTGCGAASYTYTGVPITNLNPPSNLLAPGSNSVALSFNTLQPAMCRYSTGSLLDYNSMRQFDAGPATTTHAGTITGLSSNPQVLNTVFVRCNSSPDYVQTIEYRTVAAPSGPFPRIGSIWWGNHVFFSKPDQAKKIQLYLAPFFTAEQARAVREINPNVIIVNPNVNAIDTITGVDPNTSGPEIPDNYYLKDTKGNRIEVWPGSYRLNLTKPEVAEFLAQYAYQQIVQSHLAFDGIFFDNFFTSISWMKVDRFGNPIQIDADSNGQPDDPTALDAAWRNGVYHEIATFRKLAPYAYISGHIGQNPPSPDSLAAFHGTSIVASAVNVREGLMSFGSLFNNYQTWVTSGRQAPITMIESSPPNQLAYGYGYKPAQNMPAATAAFAQGFYPNMRFGLTLSLLNDGYSTFNFGDNESPSNFWYDEYDFNLGFPLGSVSRISPEQSVNLIRNGGFESSLAGTWRLNVFNDGQGRAAAALDSTIAADGNSSAHITIASAGAANWHIDFEQGNLPLIAGANYEVQFWARADSPRVITVFSQGGPPNFTNYGLSAQIALDTTWKLYSASFLAPVTANDARLEFWVGDVAGNVWIDNVELSPSPVEIYRRDFTNGVALLNGSASPETISLEPGLQRFTGNQAPLYQYIVDDSSTSFSASGAWSAATYNTGSFGNAAGANNKLPPMPQNANGPHYHAWEGTCHQLDSSNGNAQWNLGIPADGQYTIQVWLPAAPNANTWTRNATYEIVSGDGVVASVTIDQTTVSAGDRWHTIASNINLSAAASPFLRVRNGASGSLIADAVYVASAARYNDGSPATQVTLAPMDGILLKRLQPAPASAPRVNAVVNSASFQPTIASAGFVSIFGTGFANSARGWMSSDFSGANLPVSLDGVSVTINGKQAYVAYISPTQINVLAPDDDAIGKVEVQVTTPQGKSYPGTVLKQKASPAFFTYQAGTSSHVAALHLDGTLVGPSGPFSRPAAPGEVIAMYGTGFGPTTPAAPTSQLVSQPAATTLPVSVSIGGTAAEVLWSGLVSSGLYQLNVKVPNISSGDKLVQASIGGFQSAANVALTVKSN
ncbi:MAG: putative glycoside hydrolase [Blastocatellia bacterium]